MRTAGVVSIGLALAACGGPGAPSATPAPMPARAIDYEGHRGARALAPENTLDAFGRGLELGVDTLEMDTMLTADDVLVIHHDEHLNPDITRDASGAWLAQTGPALRSLTFAQVETYDVGRIKPGTAYAARFPDQVGRDGVRIPSLEQVIAFAEERSHHQIHYNIEIKTSPDHPGDTAPPAVVAEHLVALVRSSGIAARTTIQSFDFRGLRRVAELAPELPRSCLTDASTIQLDAAAPSPWLAGLDIHAFGGSTPELVHAFGCSIWSPDDEPLTRAEVDRAHALGLRVLPWTVDEPAAIARAIAWGVDGIISDFPNRFPPRR